VHYVAKDGFTDMLQNGCSLRIEQYWITWKWFLTISAQKTLLKDV